MMINMKSFRVLFVIAITFLLAGCSHAKKTDAPAEILVKGMTVSPSSQQGDKTYVGTVEESYSSQLSFAMIGTVSQVLVDEGQAVGQGQTLAILDRATVNNAYDIAKSTLKQAQDAYNRLEGLYKKGSLPEIKYVEVQTQLAQAQANERIARKNITDCVLKAPFNGYISKRMVDVGNNVAPGIGCFTLVKIDRVKVKISIPEKEVPGISMGQSIGFKVDALGGESFVGKVVEKGVQANAFSHTYDVKLELANPGHKLLPGMVCSVSINTGGVASAIIVPQEAVMIDGTRTFVWTAVGGKAHKCVVSTSGVNNSGVIVSGGLNDGDVVIVAGQNKVSEGTKIKL